VTLGLVAINVALFLVRVFMTGSFLKVPPNELVAWGANFGPRVVAGEWWRLVTACFLHLGVIHLGVNMFVLLQVGPFAEKLFGRGRFLAGYILAGVAGNLAGIYVHPVMVAGGASGAIFGIYGMLIGFAATQRKGFPPQRMGAILRSAGVFILYNIVAGMASTGIDMAAHIGGLAGGIVLGLALSQPLSQEGPQLHGVRTLSVLVCAAAASAVALAYAPRTYTPEQQLTIRVVASPRITVGNGDMVFYDGKATRADAERLGLALVKARYFTKPGAAVFLSRDDGGPTVALLTGDKDPGRPGNGSAPAIRLTPLSWDDPHYLAGLQTTGTRIAPSLGGPPLRVQLLSRDGVLEKTVQIQNRELVTDTHDIVWYSGAATEQDAQALARLLAQLHYFQRGGSLVCLAKDASGEQVSFLAREGVWENPKAIEAFVRLGIEIGKMAPATSLTVQLIDGTMAVRATTRIH
jgi:membrane associated rhomboid family serine protease